MRPFTVKDSSDYTNLIRRRLVGNVIKAGKTPTPLVFGQSFEIKYDNELNDCFCDTLDHEGDIDNELCQRPGVPQPDYANSTQQFECFLGNTYLSNIKVAWFPVKCATSYVIRLIEYRSDSTLVQSDELKAAPANSFVKNGATYCVQYTYESDEIYSSLSSWSKRYTPQMRVAKVFAFVFAKFNGNLNANDGKAIRYSVFDVLPLVPLTTPPSISFARSTGTVSGPLISSIKIEWDPLPDAYYYRVFLVEGSGTLYVDSRTKNSLIPQRYDNTGNLFTFSSPNIFINEFERIYSPPVYSTITAFVFAYDRSNTASFFPYEAITFSGSTVTLNRTLTSPDRGIRFYLNSNSEVSTAINPTLPLPPLQTKTI